MQAPQPDDALSAHRTRTNRWPEPSGYDGHGAPLYDWQQTSTEQIAAAVNAIYDALEDRQ